MDLSDFEKVENTRVLLVNLQLLPNFLVLSVGAEDLHLLIIEIQQQ